MEREAPDDLATRLAEMVRSTCSTWVLMDPGLYKSPWSDALLGLARASLIVASLQPRSLRSLPVAAELVASKTSSLLGYLVGQPLQKMFDPGDIHASCLADLPGAFRRAFGLDGVLPTSAADDPYCLGLIDRPAGLYELASEAHKPAFHLRSADGASESLLHAAFEADRVYGELADRITERYDALVP